ncbi:MAG: hypothetical protein KJ792_02395 [Actinobacteria bacterium]|nr:hypothetical protein [Actinomycetota bacterium]MCG2801472.1 hypothetical protein [Cellulomonas sp.]
MLLLLVTLPTGRAFAATSQFDPETVSALRARMVDGGIDAATQDSLIAKLEAGQLLDSQTDAKPTGTFTVQRPGVSRTVSVFHDGSRKWIDVETPAQISSGAGVNSAAAVGSCPVSGLWRVGCTITISDPVSSAGFTIDYRIALTKHDASIREYRSPFCVNTLGGCSVSGGIKRATQNSSGPAWAAMTYSANIGIVHESGEFGIRIQDSSISTY